MKSLAKETLIITFLKIIMPNKVISAEVTDNKEKKLWLKPRISISNQFKPAPGLGIALNTKIIIAVPTIVYCSSLFKSFIKRRINIAINNNELTKMTSLEKGIFKVPKKTVKKTKVQLPKNIW